MSEKPPAGTKKWDRSVMRINVAPPQVYRNIRRNIRRPIPQLQRHDQEHPDPVMIVGGGWSLEDTFDELRDLYFRGIKVVALNNAGNWLLERNIKPSVQIVMDARPDNVYMLKEAIPGCKYLLASQCHPKLFTKCRGRETYIFHIANRNMPIESQILGAYYSGRYTAVPGAGTVGAASVFLMRLVGFRFQHLFGFDSCYAPDGRHHAYEQKLNDGEPRGPFWCAGRKFICSPWQASQAEALREMALAHGDDLELTVHGDGLIAHVIKTGAALVKKEDRSGRNSKSAVARKAGGKGKGGRGKRSGKADRGAKGPGRSNKGAAGPKTAGPRRRKGKAADGDGTKKRPAAKGGRSAEKTRRAHPGASPGSQ